MPPARHLVLALHQRAEGRRHRGRPQDPRRPGRARPQGVRRRWSSRRRRPSRGRLNRAPNRLPEPLAHVDFAHPASRAGGSVLTSPKNPKVAAAARLKKRAFRDEDRRFLVEGAQAVREALDEPGRARGAVHRPTTSIRSRCARGRTASRSTRSTDDVMARLTSTVTPQGLVGVGGLPRRRARATSPMQGCLTILHEVRDPGNAGHRAAFGRRRGRRRRGRSPRPRSTSTTPRPCARRPGRIFHLPIVRGVETRGRSRPSAGAGSGSSRWPPSGADDLYRTDLTGPVAFVFGNEAHGLPAEVVARADGTVRVPQAGPGRVAEPRGGRDRVPVRVGPAPAHAGRGARIDHRGGRARHPLAAHRDEGVRLRPREAVGRR